MSEFKQDWAKSTRFGKARFVIVVTMMLMAGGYSIYNAMIFGYYASINKTFDYEHFILSMLLLGLVFALKTIKLGPIPKDKQLHKDN